MAAMLPTIVAGSYERFLFGFQAALQVCVVIASKTSLHASVFAATTVFSS
jgi:hypothetical protein